jgi:hypothetical protein
MVYNILLDDSLPSLSSTSSLGVGARSLLAAGLVTYRAAVEACSDNLLCLSCAEGSGQCMSAAPEALSMAIVGLVSQAGV